MIQLNAQLLELLAEDKQKFQQYFVEPQILTIPTDLLQKEKHNCLSLVMQQLVMGLPVESILQANPEIAHWVNQLLPLFNIPSTTKQISASRQKLMQDALITAQYDLLILNDKKAIAVNWRSKRNIPRSRQLENSWEAQLQLFLLVETEEILPTNASLIYCFFDRDKSHTLARFSYDQEKYDAFKQRLEMALSKLSSSAIDDSEYSFHQSIDEPQLNIQRLLNGKMTTHEYLESIPEVEI